MESNNDPDNDSRLYKPSLAENLSNFDNLHNLCEIRIQSIHMLLEIKFQIKKQSFFLFSILISGFYYKLCIFCENQIKHYIQQYQTISGHGRRIFSRLCQNIFNFSLSYKEDNINILCFNIKFTLYVFQKALWGSLSLIILNFSLVSFRLVQTFTLDYHLHHHHHHHHHHLNVEIIRRL